MSTHDIKTAPASPALSPEEMTRVQVVLAAYSGLMDLLQKKITLDELVHKRLGLTKNGAAVLAERGGLQVATRVFMDTLEIPEDHAKALNILHTLALKSPAVADTLESGSRGMPVLIPEDRRALLTLWEDLTQIVASAAQQHVIVDRLNADVIAQMLR